MTPLQPNPYGAGPRLSDQPLGDPSREAVASLRGYAYQLYASALAWLDLGIEEELHLEVAEDYAIAASDALKAVQVKDTGPTAVTINTQGVRDTIVSFVRLVEQNPRQTVFVRYLTTSPIGMERSTDDRASGKATLEYWREAATSADVAPLRTVLLSVGLPTAVTDFMEVRSDSELRNDLLKRIQWDCGQPDLAAIQEELGSRLDHYGSQNLGLKGDEGRQLSGIVIKHILDVVVKPKPRRVLFSELAKLLEDATSLRVSRRVGNSLLEMAAAKMAADRGSSSKALVPCVLENEGERPMPPILTRRKNLVDDIIARAKRHSFVAICGASGMGKTVLARLAGRQLGGNWKIVDLRNASAAETIPHLDQASLELPSSRSAGVILDDLNEIEEPAARRAVIRVLSAARRNDILCFVTSYSPPSARALSELGFSPDVCVSLPDLSEDEVLEIVLAAGGTKHWMKTVYIAGGLLSKPVAGFEERNFKGVMFLFQMAGIKSVSQLQGVFDRLDQLPIKTRNELLSVAAQMPSDFSLIVNRAWQEQHERKDIDWIDCAERYLRMAEIAEKWGNRQLALRCHIARGVMFDEYAADPTRALAALDKAEKRHGADAILSRARAKIHYRRKDHSVALSLLRSVAKDAARNDHIEQSFMFREAGISAAETGNWREAAEWFGAAHEAASKMFDHMLPMRVGLLADQGVAEFKAGNLEGALRLLSDAVSQLSAVDPKSSIKAAYCHRVIRHAAFCVSVLTTNKQRWLSDLQLGIVPGMCSNPEPADLSDLPFGHIAIVWYLLAEAEIAGGVDAGIAASVSDRLGGKRIANLDVNLREARIGRAIRECSVDDLIAALDDWVASCIYLQELGDKFKEFTYESPVFGEICKPTLEQLALPIAQATRTDSLLAFGMSAVLQGRAEALVLLKIRAAAIGMEQACLDLIDCMAGCQISSDQEEYIVAAQIHRVSKGDTKLQPDEVFVAGIRFIARLNSSNLKKHIIPLLGEWMRTRWAFAMEHQTALLRSPAANRAAIEGVIAVKDDTLAYCAHLSLTVAAAATSRLATSFKEFLTQISKSQA